MEDLLRVLLSAVCQVVLLMKISSWQVSLSIQLYDTKLDLTITSGLTHSDRA